MRRSVNKLMIRRHTNKGLIIKILFRDSVLDDPCKISENNRWLFKMRFGWWK